MNAKKDASPTNKSDVINKATVQETAQKTSAQLIKQEKTSEASSSESAHDSDENRGSVVIDLDGIKEKKKTG